MSAGAMTAPVLDGVPTLPELQAMLAQIQEKNGALEAHVAAIASRIAWLDEELLGAVVTVLAYPGLRWLTGTEGGNWIGCLVDADGEQVQFGWNEAYSLMELVQTMATYIREHDLEVTP